MSKITIKRGDNSSLSSHFTAAEFFSKSSNVPASHDFYSELVEAVQFLRNHYGKPWRITSTYRPDSAGSQHRECRAVDSQDVASGHGNPSPVILDLVSNLLDPKSAIFRKLRQIGITGFGVYDTFVHLDVRTQPGAHTDSFGHFAFWDERSELTKKKVLTSTVKVLSKKLSQPTKAVLNPSPGKSSLVS